MQWLDQWRALSARIEGLLEASRVFAHHYESAGRHDLFQVIGKAFKPELASLHAELTAFARADHDLPREAVAALRDYQEHERHWDGAVNGGQVAGVVPIALLRPRFEYAIRDAETTGRTRTELAFEHLQRSIAVDPGIRERWREAFSVDEPACEKLGAVHLLSHGIWAFKVHAGGAITDLVYAEPIQDELDQIQRTASALVLTEWKRVTDPDELAEMARQAREQTNRYKSGALGALELKRTRYVVLVTEREERPPSDQTTPDGVRFRHLTLAVNPQKASAVRPRRDR